MSKIFNKNLPLSQSADFHRVSNVVKQKRRFVILKRRFCTPKSHL